MTTTTPSPRKRAILFTTTGQPVVIGGPEENWRQGIVRILSTQLGYVTGTTFGDFHQSYRSDSQIEDTKIDLPPMDYYVEAKQLGEVKAIYWKEQDGVTYIWTAIAPLDETVAAKLYALEAALYKKYTEAVFDFYVFEANDTIRPRAEGFDVLYEKK